jgi:predicted double-glycine peptidase
MHEVLNALGVTGVAVVLAWLGHRLARKRGRWWMWGWIVPLLTLYVAAFGLNFRKYAFMPPMSWLVGGWGRWMVIAWAASLTLGTLIGKLPRASTRRVLWFLCGVIILRTATLPFLSPLLSQSAFGCLTTTVDQDGVCLQGTPYSCGPAAAVTALRKLGFKAEENRLAGLSGTTMLIGTPDDMLAEALRKEYGPQGLKVEWRYVASVDELRSWPVSIAVIKYNQFVDHYVTVLGFDGDQIIVGDPLNGRNIMPIEEFLKTWHHVSILMRRG